MGIKNLLASLGLLPAIVLAQTPHMPDLVKQARTCETLTCVRQQIDTIDTQLVSLLAKRLAYVQRAGELKHNTPSVHDAEREQKILARVSEQAEKIGYPAEIVRNLFRTLLKETNQYEQTFHRGNNS